MEPLEGFALVILAGWLGPNPLGQVLAPPSEATVVPNAPFGIDLKFLVEIADEFETVIGRTGDLFHRPQKTAPDRWGQQPSVS